MYAQRFSVLVRYHFLIIITRTQYEKIQNGRCLHKTRRETDERNRLPRRETITVRRVRSGPPPPCLYAEIENKNTRDVSLLAPARLGPHRCFTPASNHNAAVFHFQRNYRRSCKLHTTPYPPYGLNTAHGVAFEHSFVNQHTPSPKRSPRRRRFQNDCGRLRPRRFRDGVARPRTRRVFASVKSPLQVDIVFAEKRHADAAPSEEW